ncbi:non-specific lipid-transfer protein-like [Rosa sericea]
MLALSKMVTIVILLLGVSWSAIGAPLTPHYPETCKTTLDLLDPCFPLYDPSEPTPACCKAAAPLSNQVIAKKLYECLEDLQKAGPLNLSALRLLFPACDVSVKLPPARVSDDMDCSQYELEDSRVATYWVFCYDPSMGFYWQYRIRFSTSVMNRNGNENNSALVSVE